MSRLPGIGFPSSYKLKSFGAWQEDHEELSECVICMQEFKDSDQIAELRCDSRHIFHKKCIEDWLKNNDTCPTCRRNVKEN